MESAWKIWLVCAITSITVLLSIAAGIWIEREVSIASSLDRRPRI